jgi:hypothetical protein
MMAWMLLWPRLRIIKGIERPLYPILLAILLAGCSAKNRIDNHAVAIRESTTVVAANLDAITVLAVASGERFTAAGDADGVAEQAEIKTLAAGGFAANGLIADAASGIRADLHGVEDIVPWWASLIGQVAIAAAVVAVLILLWKSGALDFIRRLFWAVGMLIPRKSKAEAVMDLAALDDNDDMTVKETVAAKRARDPAYSAAFRREQRRRI